MGGKWRWFYPISGWAKRDSELLTEQNWTFLNTFWGFC
jgi:hypothetical protein